MKKHTLISKVAAVVMIVCALVVSSCEKPVKGNDTLEVSVKNSSVASGKGQMFVNVKCASSWTLSLTDEDGADIDWAVVNPSSGTGNMSNVILTWQVNEAEESRTLVIVLDNGSSWKSCQVVQAGSGQHPEPEPDPLPQPEKDLTKVSWLELPAMDDPDLGYYSHSFEMNGKEYRNYSFGWSQNDLVALWVAYPLSKLYLNGNAGYTKAWAYDPLLGSEYSSAPFGGYGGPYDRGHQLPSGDRQCCFDANAQTFYGTNMTPQSNSFNTGIWVDLENKVRNVAKTSDTTYVVTGCVVKNPIGYTTDSDGKKMTIPSAYFKALLKYSKSSTLGQWNAAAFYLDHDETLSLITKSHSISIDELEEITGIDFFVNLPSKIGEEQAAKIEATDPASSSVWW